MDRTYQSRIRLRRELLRTNESDVVACNHVANDAVIELYTWLTAVYLPQRFPAWFDLTQASDAKSAKALRNKVTNESLPVYPSSPMKALHALTSHIDTDFLVLLPRHVSSPGNTSNSSHIYHLEAFTTCFPSGFHTPSKLSLPLAAIHAPVPGYAVKLERSMDRYFAQLPVGKIVRRANWSVTTTRELFCLSGTHGAVGPEIPIPNLNEHASQDLSAEGTEEQAELDQDVDLENTVLRCERQTLHRLPESKALVFAFKTYQYELQDLKDEGSGEALANAIEGLEKGNVPEMRQYKRGNVWGRKVVEYLRT
jgi:hypothetical protein